MKTHAQRPTIDQMNLTEILRGAQLDVQLKKDGKRAEHYRCLPVRVDPAAGKVYWDQTINMDGEDGPKADPSAIKELSEIRWIGEDENGRIQIRFKWGHTVTICPPGDPSNLNFGQYY